ncbi:Ig-like domain-containing protein [Treponema sp.]|uniref:Ig-like domain-containing protein n=1 Tax=Treponema sp. TaxID=166 RepID=UPI003FD87DD5
MKKMLRIAAAFAALLAMTNFIGCKNDDDDDGDVAVTGVKITSTVTAVTVGEKITLTAKVLPENATNKTVTWTSSDTTVATVKDGVVTGVAAGTAKITAKAGEKTDTVEVTVKAAATSGGETGGSTGGETGTTTGFENTYWVLEEVSYENGGIKITLKNAQYIHLGDSTSGSSYIANVEDYLKGAPSAGTYSVSYPDKGGEFTYTVEGSNVTIRMGEETISAVIVDENSFRITDESTAATHTYTKIAAAPTEATVTVEVTAAPSTKVLDVVYDLTTGLPTDFPTADTFISADWDAPVATPATNDITWTWIAAPTRKVKNSTGLQVSNGSSVEDMITLSADSDFTVTVTYKFAGGYVEGKVRCITVGDKSDSMTSTTDKSKEYTLTTTAAKTATIAMNGMKLLKVETKAAN